MNEAKQQNLFGDGAEEPMPWELAAEADRLAAQVVFNRRLETIYYYLVPDELRESIQPGVRVKVPFGKGDRLTVGYCVGLGPPQTSRALKAVRSVLDRRPLLSPKMLALTRWMAERYLCGWGQVLETVVPAGVKNQAGTRIVKLLRATSEADTMLKAPDLPPKQRDVLTVLCSAGQPMRIEELAASAGCGTGPVTALRKKGLIEAVPGRAETFTPEPGPVEPHEDLVLTPHQRSALEAIVGALRSQEHQTFLLHGVTGSGKTEVYIRAIQEVVGYGRQAIVLVPEISLTPQTIRRFRSRFEQVAVLHSHLSDAERHWHWQRIAGGQVQVVVGARSAVFAPTPHLGIIVIDEEHETTFKQETTPRYHAREVARERARQEGVPLILGSATPTLESWMRVQQKQDVLLSLPMRVEQRPLPPVVLVDIRNDVHCSRGAAIGRALREAMRAALEDGGQVILLLNIRGFSPTLWCRACGESVQCPSCDVTLTWHKDRQAALCHLCGFQGVPPQRCPSCGHGGMRYLGAGTQRLEEEVRAKFPGANVLRMDSDTMRRHGSHDAALEAFRRGEVQVLLGTQMIAKGLDFPNVTLVGVVDADTSLHQPDLRAAERTFQLIAQVAGRTGRGTRFGRVFVQTCCPGEPAIRLAAEHDYAGFVRQELVHRREMEVPPYCHLCRVILRGRDESKVQQQSDVMAELLRQTVGAEKLPVRLLGPAPAPLAKLKNRYRYHFQLAAEQVETIQRLWRGVADQLPTTKDVEHIVDVDPLDMR